jgi:diacylglycerol O-acyltransferase / trehalose O-mycolyltransferase
VRVVLARRLLVMLATALLLAACASPAPGSSTSPARVIARQQLDARLWDITLDSPAVGGPVPVRLLLPARYAAAPTQRWPVLYLLHGCCDSYQSWTRSTDIESIPALRHVLVVMPEGGNIGFYSDWRDGPAWETFHTAELPELLERSYGAGTPRAIAGLSMGGLGAMDYAARHPGMFAAAASFSGVLHPLAEPKIWLGLFNAYTDDPLKVWGDLKRDRANWAAHDPAELAARLRGTRIFVSSGSGPGDATEAIVGRESRAFAARLRKLGIPAQLHLYRGGHHDWPYWQREFHRALPILLG